MWVIHKKSQTAGRVSYAGHTWDMANMRDEYRETFRNKKYAQILACYLGRNSDIEFKVSRRAKKEAHGA